MKNFFVNVASAVFAAVAAFSFFAASAVFLPQLAYADEPISAQKYFPDSDMPDALRYRLANKLLGNSRLADPELESYLHHINTLLAADDDYLILAADTPEVNAFASYGGVIVMFRGLLELTEEEDEFLSVVSHEMGHIKLEHFKKHQENLERNSVLSLPVLIAGLMVDDQDAREAIIAGGTGLFQRNLYAYSRELEHEADVFGLDTMLKNERDGKMMVRVFSRLGGSKSDYNSTHPAPLRRGSYLEGRLRGFESPPPRQENDFYLLREKLALKGDILAGEFENERRRKIAENESPRDVLVAQYGLLLLATQTRNKKLGEEFSAVLADNEHPYIMRAVADNMQSRGDKKAALALLEKARKQYPNSAALLLDEMRLLERTNDNKKAVEIFDGLPPALAERADVLRQAGRSAARLGLPVRSNYLLAAAATTAGDFEQAEKHIIIAERNGGGDLETLTKLTELKGDVKKELEMLREGAAS